MNSSINNLNSRHKFQFTAKICRSGDYIIGTKIYLPNFEYYTKEQAFDFLRTFDCTTRNICQQMLKHYKTRLNQLLLLPETIEPRTRKILKDNIALLELIFIYTIWYQGNMDLNDSQITYYSDEKY